MSLQVLKYSVKIILAIDQLNEQIIIFLISLLYSPTCFEHCCAHHQEVELCYTASHIITPVGGRPCATCALDGHLQNVTIPDAV